MTAVKLLVAQFLHISSMKYSREKKLKVESFVKNLGMMNPKDVNDFFILLSEHIAGKEDLLKMLSKKLDSVS